MIVSNVLPIRAKRLPEGWDFEWDEDALVAQAKVILQQRQQQQQQQQQQREASAAAGGAAIGSVLGLSCSISACTRCMAVTAQFLKDRHLC
jgi:hypothetical protein